MDATDRVSRAVSTRMKRWLLIVLALLAFALAACRAPAGEPGPTSASAEPSETPAASSSPAASSDPYDY